MTYRVHSVEAFTGNQVIVWLEDEQTGARGPGNGSQWCVRVTIDEAPAILSALLSAYVTSIQNVVIELAAGGCRTCRGERRINVNHLSRLMGGDGGGEPCPVCMPRAEKRLRQYLRMRRSR